MKHFFFNLYLIYCYFNLPLGFLKYTIVTGRFFLLESVRFCYSLCTSVLLPLIWHLANLVTQLATLYAFYLLTKYLSISTKYDKTEQYTNGKAEIKIRKAWGREETF